ncbi:MAG: DUF2460 domain-containing protein, partial [Thermodesulfovibrionia bacterium]|nr:DUF2460 domain-containing protein [Thermodesulfovibrionia bacterium]
MTTFPEIASVPFGNPVEEEIQFRTLTTKFAGLGEEQRKQKWLYPRRLVTLRYSFISKTEAQTFFQFYINRGGSYNTFKFFYPDVKSTPFSYVDEYVGTGDGSETVFNLPAKDSGNYTLNLDGVSQSDPSDYSFGAGGGSDGEDKVTFVAAPDAGGRITFSFTGRLKIVGKFRDDKLKFQLFF